jgi:hypothetical protein
MPKRERGLLRGLGLEQDIRTAMAIAVGGLGPDMANLVSAIEGLRADMTTLMTAREGLKADMTALLTVMEGLRADTRQALVRPNTPKTIPDISPLLGRCFEYITTHPLHCERSK